MVKIPNMLVENEHQELVPSDTEHWQIRIKTGEFIESLISFGKIIVDESADSLKFDFTLHYSPDPDLTVDSIGLQKHAGKILESVVMSTLENTEEK